MESYLEGLYIASMTSLHDRHVFQFLACAIAIACVSSIEVTLRSQQECWCSSKQLVNRGLQAHGVPAPCILGNLRSTTNTLIMSAHCAEKVLQALIQSDTTLQHILAKLESTCSGRAKIFVCIPVKGDCATGQVGRCSHWCLESSSAGF